MSSDDPTRPAHFPPQAPTSEGGDDAAALERANAAARLGITWNGRHYCYRHYRYDRLDNALAYARHEASLPARADADESRSAEVVEVPATARLEEMQAMGVTYAHGVYALGAYRYERLDDALAQARRGPA